MEESSRHPSVPIPECGSTLATTLPAPPAAFALTYPDVVWCQRVSVTTLVWNLD
jgi:hypothetical protein